jgi:hypothetical protein
MMRVLISLLILVCTTGCAYVQRNETAPEQMYTRIGYEEQQTEAEEIRVLEITETVRPGESAMLTIQGAPGVSYNAAATYMLGDDMATASQSKVAGADGRVTWNWIVNINTLPGRYAISVSGGGKTFITFYTVTR